MVQLKNHLTIAIPSCPFGIHMGKQQTCACNGTESQQAQEQNSNGNGAMLLLGHLQEPQNNWEQQEMTQKMGNDSQKQHKNGPQCLLCHYNLEFRKKLKNNLAIAQQR